MNRHFGIVSFSLVCAALAFGCTRSSETELRERTESRIAAENAGTEENAGAAEEGGNAAPARPSAPAEEGDSLRTEAPDDVAAPPANAERTASGLASRVLRPGTGDVHPAATDRVQVHYSGWTTDGERFDSSVLRGAPASFPLRGVIAGWTEGLQLMVEGERRRFWIPESLAYQGRPGRPAGMLVFDVELIDIL